MKCPNNIKNLIKRRTKYAEKFLAIDLEISTWCTENNIKTEMILTSIETICSPNEGEDTLFKDIENSEEGN